MISFKQLIETITITGGEKAHVKPRQIQLHSANDGPFGGQLFRDMTKAEHIKASKYHDAEMKKQKN